MSGWPGMAQASDAVGDTVAEPAVWWYQGSAPALWATLPCGVRKKRCLGRRSWNCFQAGSHPLHFPAIALMPCWEVIAGLGCHKVPVLWVPL